MRRIGFRKHLYKNMELATPIVLSQAGHITVNIADNIMIGQVDVVSLAAASFSNAIFFLSMMICIGFSFGLTPLTAAAEGEGNESAIGGLLRHSLLINISLAILMAFSLWQLTQYLHLFEQPAEVIRLAAPYLLINALSLIPFMLFQTGREYTAGLSMTVQAMIITLAANLINIGLNYVLIFGHLGFEPMGLNGAGYATFTARTLMALGFVAFIAIHPRFAEHRKTFIGAINFETARRILAIGGPAALQFTFEVSAFSMAAIMSGWLGTEPLAAHQIAINLSSFSYMFASGLAAAASIRVGNQFGKKDFPTLREVGLSNLVLSVMMMTGFALIFIGFRYTLAGFYVDESEVIQLAGGLIVIASIFQIPDGIQVVGLGILRGMTDVLYPTLYTLIAYWLLGLPAGYILGFELGWGVNGIWTGLLIGLSSSALLLFIRFRRQSKLAMLSTL